MNINYGRFPNSLIPIKKNINKKAIPHACTQGIAHTFSFSEALFSFRLSSYYLLNLFIGILYLLISSAAFVAFVTVKNGQIRSDLILINKKEHTNSRHMAE